MIGKPPLDENEIDLPREAIMPKNAILRLFLVNWTLGVLLGVGFASAFLLFDVAGLKSLIMRSEFIAPAIALLYGGFAITCGGVVCASAIMRMPQDEGRGEPGVGVPIQLVPVPVRSR